MSNNVPKQTTRVRVLVRCRPPIRSEQARRCDRVIVNKENNAIVVRSKNYLMDSDGDSTSARQFNFDRVFDMRQSQSEVFDEVRPLITHTLNGFHATIFAYGQTGSGKTYTMEGLNYKLLQSERQTFTTSSTLSLSTSNKRELSSSSTTTSAPSPQLLISSSTTVNSNGNNNSIDNNCLNTFEPTEYELESSWGVQADVTHTPVEQHGIVPRMIQLLYDEARQREKQQQQQEEQQYCYQKENEELDMETVHGNKSKGLPFSKENKVRSNELDADQIKAKEESNVKINSHQRVKYSFKCSYYQIYNEKITDLLRPCPTQRWQKPEKSNYSHYKNGSNNKREFYERCTRDVNDDGLRLRWHDDDRFTVENLFQCECKDAASMRNAFFSGVQEKVMSSHGMNWQSSRSHCIFTIYICCSNLESNEVICQSELSLVDLAGSEKLRQMSTQPSARLLRESIEINTSLLTLGKVITALANVRSNKTINNNKNNYNNYNNSSTHSREEKRPMSNASQQSGNVWQSARVHIPYRESKLTKLLKHALGGNSLTVMIACINPCDDYVEETLSTLLYAGKARRITNVLHQNEEPTRALLNQLRAEIAHLKTELAYYQTLAHNTITKESAHVEEMMKKKNISETHTESNNREEEAIELEEEEEEKQQLQSEEHETHVSTMIENCNGNSNSKHVEELSVTSEEVNKLADALLSACEMLQNIMLVNKELREAYDIIKQSNQEALRREAELNAENMALRERVSTLERITLNSTFVNDEASATESPTELCASEEETEKEKESETEEQALLASTFLPVNTRTDVKWEKICSPNANLLFENSNKYFANSTNNVSDVETHQSSKSSERKKHREIVPMEELQSAKKEEHQQYEECLVSTENTSTAVSNEPNGVSSSSLRSEHSLVLSSLSSPPVLTRPIQKEQQQQQQRELSNVRPKNVPNHTRKLTKLLEAYTSKYKHPTQNVDYNKYYKSLASKLPQSSPAQRTIERVNELLQTTEATYDVKALIPQSVLRTNTFGKLSFGGNEDEKNVFEQKRAEREERRQALLQRQQQLYSAVHENIHSCSNGNSNHTVKKKKNINLYSSSSVNKNNSKLENKNAEAHHQEQDYYDHHHHHHEHWHHERINCNDLHKEQYAATSNYMEQKQFAKTMELPRVRDAKDVVTNTGRIKNAATGLNTILQENNKQIATARERAVSIPMLIKSTEIYNNYNNYNNYNHSNQVKNDNDVYTLRQSRVNTHAEAKDKSNASHVAELLQYLNNKKNWNVNVNTTMEEEESKYTHLSQEPM